MGIDATGHGARGTGHERRPAIERVLALVELDKTMPGARRVLLFPCPVPRAPSPSSRSAA